MCKLNPCSACRERFFTLGFSEIVFSTRTVIFIIFFFSFYDNIKRNLDKYVFLFSFVIRFYYIKICPIPTKELKESEAKNEKTK